MRHIWHFYLTSKITKIHLPRGCKIVGAIMTKVSTGDKHHYDYPTIIVEAPEGHEPAISWPEFLVRLIAKGESVAPDEQYVAALSTEHATYIIYAVYPKVETVVGETAADQ